jgi:hypothetical protein
MLSLCAALMTTAAEARAEPGATTSGPPIRLRAVAELGFLAVLDHRIQFGRDGTTFDYVDEGGQNTLFSVARMSIEAHLRRHQIIFLYQPLEIVTNAVTRRDVRVDQTLFEAGTPIQVRYGFPFYRMTYQYDLLACAGRELSLGLALQIRNATIEFESRDGTLLSSNGGVGPVPLLAARGRLPVAAGVWLGFETVGFYAPISYFNGDDNGVIGAILDASVRLGVALPHGAEAFLNLRYLGGGAQGDDDDAEPPSDGYTKNWLHFLLLTLGGSIGT